MTNAPRILLAEADGPVRAFLTDNLAADGYQVQPVATEHAALVELTGGQLAVDLLLVDVNGRTLGLVDAVRNSARPLAQTPSDLPIVALTSRPDSVHCVRLLERGADDVVIKPFGYAELRARLAAVLRRTAPRTARPPIIAGDLRVDLHERQVAVAGQPVTLSGTEYRLLCALGAEPTRVFTRAELMAAVWGYSGDARTRTLDSHAHRLRRKLSAASHPLIITVWGIGLQLIPIAALTE